MSPRLAFVIEQILVFLVLLCYSYCINFPLTVTFENPVALSFFQKTAKLVAIGLTFLFFIRQPKAFLNILARASGLCLFVLYITSTALWANDSFVVLKEAILLMILIGFSIYLACNFKQTNVLFLLLGVHTLGSLLSLMWWYLFPQESWASTTFGASGEIIFGLKGSYPHKNHLALAMNLAILCSLSLWLMKQISGFLMLPLCGLFTFLLVCSHSVSNLVLLAITLPMFFVEHFFFNRHSKSRGLILSMGLIILIFMGGLGFQYLPKISQRLNRKSNLSGRLVIWEKSLEAVKAKPWQGYGFNSFWPKHKNIEKFPEAYKIWNELEWASPGAHNAYIDLLLGTGGIGLILGTLALGQLLVQSSDSRNQNLYNISPKSPFKNSFLLMMLVINTVESILINPRYLYGMILLFILFCDMSTDQKKIPTTLFGGSFKTD